MTAKRTGLSIYKKRQIEEILPEHLRKPVKAKYREEWSAEHHEILALLWPVKGISASDIGDYIGRSKNSVISQAHKKPLGDSAYINRGSWTDDRQARLKEMTEKGATPEQISDALGGVGPDAVKYMQRERNLIQYQDIDNMADFIDRSTENLPLGTQHLKAMRSAMKKHFARASCPFRIRTNDTKYHFEANFRSTAKKLGLEFNELADMIIKEPSLISLPPEQITDSAKTIIRLKDAGLIKSDDIFGDMMAMPRCLRYPSSNLRLRGLWALIQQTNAPSIFKPPRINSFLVKPSLSVLQAAITSYYTHSKGKDGQSNAARVLRALHRPRLYPEGIKRRMLKECPEWAKAEP